MRRLFVLALAVFAVLPACAYAGPFGALAAPRIATALPPGFAESVVWSGLVDPTVIRFAPDGGVFVATKAGLVYRFDSLDDPTPSVFADLRDEVHDYWDRGLLGMALDPNRPYVYVAYSHDSKPWGDGCPTPPGPTEDGCVIDGRLSRLDAQGHETVLLQDFCQQYPSHSVGSLQFGRDGMLYLSAGEGAHFNFADFGQVSFHAPRNPCADPVGWGGALRAQSFRRPAGQPVSLDGAILRLNPDTGAAAAGNPAQGDRGRIIAYGLRNPFRFTLRPGTDEIWTGDVGWDTWEEIDRIPDAAQVRNYGWPCYEGPGIQGAYTSLGLAGCQGLSDTVAPYFAYRHDQPLGDGCAAGGSSVSALTFYTGDAFPPAYRGALFFGDYSRECLWVMLPGANGLPDPATVRPFAVGASGPVYLTEGPDGALYYADLNGGTVRRISHGPQASIAVTAHGPFSFSFDGTGSTGDGLRYEWDFGDGTAGSTQPAPDHVYATSGAYPVRLRVTDASGLSVSTTTTVKAGVPPVVTISAPSAATTWAVGDTIAFAGAASADGTPLAASALGWTLALRHCPDACHTHTLQRFPGVATGSFVAPDHEYPSHLELSLTATANGLSTTETRELDPRTADITLASSPSGLSISFASETAATPFTRTLIAGSVTTITAATPQGPYAWRAWSDGLGRSHEIKAPASGAATYTASFDGPAPVPPAATPAPAPGPVGAWGFDEASGRTARDASGHGDRGRLTGPLRVRGHFGHALDFDGADDWVTLRAPRLRAAMTVEAWVYPTRRGGSLALSETARGAAWSLYGAQAGVGAKLARGRAPRLRRWTHLAMTYDGSAVRRYVNGVLAGTRAAHGALASSRYPLRFGGNAVWPEWFRGRLDEVRVYDRALTPAAIRADMTTPVNARAQRLKRVKRTRAGARVKRYRGRSRTHR